MNAAGWLLVAAACAPADRPAVPSHGAPRTAVLVVLDTLRADRLGAYGGREGVSPRFDALAVEGALFTDAWASAPWTLPSHATLFTGLEPAAHGCDAGTLRFDGRAPLLAERFSEAGYATGGFSNNPWVTSSTGLAGGFDVFVEVFRRSVSAGTAINRFVDPRHLGLTDAGAARTVAALNRWLDEVDGPAFVFVNLVEPHLPYDPPDGWRGRWHAAPVLLSDVHAFHERWLVRAHRGELRPEDRAEALDLYDEEVTYADAHLGRIADVLRDHGRLDEALIAVTSDHGEAMGEHRTDGIDLVDHQLSLYEELLRVPLLVRWPGRVPGGTRIEGPVGLVDVFPLFDGAREGRFVPPPAGDPDRVRRAAYARPRMHRAVLAEYVPDVALTDRLANRGLRAVRQGTYKLIAPDDGAPLLFDLSADPGETVDLADSEPERVAGLLELLPPPSEEGTATPAAETIEALRALGYVRTDE